MIVRATWRIEVVYATPERQEVIAVSAEPGSTVEQVIRLSGILNRFPEIDLSRQRVGVFGELVELNDPLRDGDRIEIYRPLLVDPKETRKQRAARHTRSRSKRR